jgi:hypothetical protein
MFRSQALRFVVLGLAVAMVVPTTGWSQVKSTTAVRDYSSRNYLLHTDLPADEAQELLKRLETMLTIVSRYWNARSSRVIEMYVIKDLANWPPGSIDPQAMASIENRAGITLSTTQFVRDTRGNERITAAHSVVYAIADGGVPQHEAVHAFCHQSFGRTGPVWYAEGMAELGQYWRDKQSDVEIHDYVLEYLQQTDPKPLAEIVDPDQRTGDSWQNYAWRWALCHLLNYNPNYQPRFRPLGLSLLSGQGASFEQTYGDLAPEIAFEYRFFLEHLTNGYRCDLAAWDWKTKCVQLRKGASVQAKIDARKGWQPTRLRAQEGTTYSWTTTGTWKTSEAGEMSANGNEQGEGKLVGILFDDYRLSDVFELGESGEWTATGEGDLHVRCRDDWGRLGDNTGTVTVRWTLAK